MDKNPFVFGRPVRKENFYNREEEIEIAVGLIKKMQSFSIIGERRIGKTSFIEHIFSEEVLEDHGIEYEAYVIIYLNMGSLYAITKEEFIAAVVDGIREPKCNGSYCES